jgi:transcriptional regulator with XRE-family HTH domain
MLFNTKLEYICNRKFVLKMIDSKKTLKDIGENLRIARKRNKLTLLDVQFETGTDIGHLSKIENGEHKHITVDKIYNLCAFYEVSIYDIIAPRELQ